MSTFGVTVQGRTGPIQYLDAGATAHEVLLNACDRFLVEGAAVTEVPDMVMRDLLQLLLDDHQRVYPHHAHLCNLCRLTQAAITDAPL